jgi:hypothetical protein
MNQNTGNPSITVETRPLVEALSRFAAQPDVAAALQRARADAVLRLQREPGLASAFVALDPVALGWPTPDAVGSIRVSVTRGAGSETVERHANSTQYLLVLDGPVETHVQTDAGWRVDRYGDGRSAELGDRWHVVPPGLWHRTIAPGAQTWGVVAFHSAREVSDEYR